MPILSISTNKRTLQNYMELAFTRARDSAVLRADQLVVTQLNASQLKPAQLAQRPLHLVNASDFGIPRNSKMSESVSHSRTGSRANVATENSPLTLLLYHLEQCMYHQSVPLTRRHSPDICRSWLAVEPSGYLMELLQR